MLHWRARFFARTAPAWRRLASIESSVLRDDIEQVAIEKPIYIAGVPRAGSTIVTEMLSRHPDVTSHRYSDFPNVYTPYWRNWLAQRSQRKPAKAVERAHRDRIMISNESPEAVEEVIWMHFFDHLHDPALDQSLTRDTDNPAFERFYRDHIRKLLLVRKRSRYLAKGNYNATRLGYIRKVFPDARLVVPVRNPINQVASLVKQDRLFEQANMEDPRVDRQLRMSGHFEFGPGRCAVRIGDGENARTIHEHWQAGRSVAGWALYWNSIYNHVLDALEHDRDLESAVLLLRYEDLCRDPEATIRQLLDHLQLDIPRAEPLISDYVSRITAPDYYEPDFSDEELEQLYTITRPVASRLGYVA
ncbi:sulfotransferase [Wenzhouxiangella sp. XN201]|uniref:sulfotransferase family protein n=1 Tax=Wenzhouxiangella sp. XN201 TaxID=2710755 RepID=UPI0013CB04F4|nr:sulfotransferase [Wenzhouxiangella sp. XN201]NEZ04129.1 sulfotransferase [Wenzhouxiangella sp. XN201]